MCRRFGGSAELNLQVVVPKYVVANLLFLVVQRISLSSTLCLFGEAFPCEPLLGSLLVNGRRTGRFFATVQVSR